MNNLHQKICEATAQQEPFFHKDSFRDVFSWKELFSLLNNTPFINYERFNIIGENLSPLHPDFVSEWQTDKTIIGPKRVKRYIDNFVCYLTDCSRVNKTINDICQHLESVNSMSCDAHIFFSLKDRQEDTDGFGMHNDVSHNFIIQIEGSTHFTVQDKFEITLTPGDCVYVPAGINHMAKSLEKRLSVSFPMNPKHKVLQQRTWLCI